MPYRSNTQPNPEKRTLGVSSTSEGLNRQFLGRTAHQTTPSLHVNGVSETDWRSSGAVTRAEDAAESSPGLDLHDQGKDMRNQISSEERIDLGTTGGYTEEKCVQRVWGLRYIDDTVLRRTDANQDCDDDASERTDYSLTAPRFSVCAVVDDAGGFAGACVVLRLRRGPAPLPG